MGHSTVIIVGTKSDGQTQSVLVNSEGAIMTVSNEDKIVLTGRVGSDGTISAGTGFSVVRNGDGDYSITFSESLANVPVVNPVADDASVEGLYASYGTVTTAGFKVYTWLGVATPVDGAFNFTVTTVS